MNKPTPTQGRQSQLKCLLFFSVIAVTALLGWAYRPPSDTKLCNLQSSQSRLNDSRLPRELNLLVWNVQKHSQADWSASFKQLSKNSDLILLQEAVLEANIGGLLGRDMHQSFAPGYRSANGQTGVLSLSTATAVGQCQLSAEEPWLGTAKAIAVAQYPISNRDDTVLTINLHGLNFTFGTEDLQRQLGSLSTIIKAHQGPVILAGDINTWSIARQQAMTEFAQDHGLLAAQFEPDARTQPFGYPLDHVYLRDIDVISATVEAVASSDHNPLLLRLRISPAS